MFIANIFASNILPIIIFLYFIFFSDDHNTFHCNFANVKYIQLKEQQKEKKLNLNFPIKCSARFAQGLSIFPVAK